MHRSIQNPLTHSLHRLHPPSSCRTSRNLHHHHHRQQQVRRSTGPPSLRFLCIVPVCRGSVFEQTTEEHARQTRHDTTPTAHSIDYHAWKQAFSSPLCICISTLLTRHLPYLDLYSARIPRFILWVGIHGMAAKFVASSADPPLGESQNEVVHPDLVDPCPVTDTVILHERCECPLEMLNNI